MPKAQGALDCVPGARESARDEGDLVGDTPHPARHGESHEVIGWIRIDRDVDEVRRGRGGADHKRTSHTHDVGALSADLRSSSRSPSSRGVKAEAEYLALGLGVSLRLGRRPFALLISVS